MNEEEDSEPSSTAAALLQRAAGMGLAFAVNLLVGMGLVAAALSVPPLGGVAGLWLGCLGAAQLVYIVPLFLICRQRQRQLAIGVAMGAATVALLQGALYGLYFALIYVITRPTPGIPGTFEAEYGPIVVRAGEEILPPERVSESELCGPGALSCPGPRSWRTVHVMENDPGDLHFTFEGLPLPAGAQDHASAVLDEEWWFEATYTHPPDRCEGVGAEMTATLSRDGDALRGVIVHWWPEGCVVGEHRFEQPLEISREFVARQLESSR